MKLLAWLTAATAATAWLPGVVHGFSASRISRRSSKGPIYSSSSSNGNGNNGEVSSATSSASTSSSSTIKQPQKQDDSFISRQFNTFAVDGSAASDIDDNNCSPTLQVIMKNIRQLTHQGSDIRGRFLDHARVGRISLVAKAMQQQKKQDGIPALTPFVAFCLGHAFGQVIMNDQIDTDAIPTIAIGRDPRPHGSMLCDAFARGIQTVHDKIRVVYTGIATTPSMFHFCRYVTAHSSVILHRSWVGLGWAWKDLDRSTHMMDFCLLSLSHSLSFVYWTTQTQTHVHTPHKKVLDCAMVPSWSQPHICHWIEMVSNCSAANRVVSPNPRYNK